MLKLIGKAPEEIKLEADWASIKDEPRRDRDRNGRGGSSGGGGRTSSRDRDRDRRPRPVPVHGEVAAMQPFDPAAAPVDYDLVVGQSSNVYHQRNGLDSASLLRRLASAKAA